MNRAPKVGDRVSFRGNCVIGPCAGIVMRVYKSYTHPEDFDWESDENPPITGVAPECEWHVGVKVDPVPELWPYLGTDRFAPVVSDLEPSP